MIAHRLTTIRNCDKIIVIDEGRKVEEGTHDFLMNIPVRKEKRVGKTKKDEETEKVLSGFYHDLWDTQMGESSSIKNREQKTTRTDSTWESEKELEMPRPCLRSVGCKSDLDMPPDVNRLDSANLLRREASHNK